MSRNPPPRGRNYPFAQRGSAFWEKCHVTFDQAVDMFYDQTAMQQHLGHDPIVNSLVYKRVTYPTIFDAQRAYTQDQNAFYQKKEQEQLALEARGIKAFKNMNDAIRSRLNPTEDGLANPLERPLKPMGEVSKGIFEQFTSGFGHESLRSNATTPDNSTMLSESSGQQAYEFSKDEWSKDLQKQAKEYQWDTSQQKNISIALFTVEEANEYLDLLIKDTHGQLSTGKDYTGVGMGLKGAYDVAKELGGWGAIAKAVNINGVMNIVVENYKPRYLDLGIRWQEATPQMLKIGHALNTVQGNISFLRGNIFVEFVFSGAVNSVDYMLHDEKTLGEVVGQFTSDVARGVVTGVIAQGVTVLGVAALSTVFAVPTALTLGVFAISAFIIGNQISKLDGQYKFTEPMKKQVEEVIDSF